MTLHQIKKNYFDKTVFQTILYNKKIIIIGIFFLDKGSGSGIFPGPDPGDPKRPDPDPKICRIEIIQF